MHWYIDMSGGGISLSSKIWRVAGFGVLSLLFGVLKGRTCIDCVSFDWASFLRLFCWAGGGMLGALFACCWFQWIWWRFLSYTILDRFSLKLILRHQNSQKDDLDLLLSFCLGAGGFAGFVLFIGLPSTCVDAVRLTWKFHAGAIGLDFDFDFDCGAAMALRGFGSGLNSNCGSCCSCIGSSSGSYSWNSGRGVSTVSVWRSISKMYFSLPIVMGRNLPYGFHSGCYET